MKTFDNIIQKLSKKKKTISVMESCTGGGIMNAITNIEGASEVFQFGTVTYSNEYKIKMGVPKEVIEQNTVYSIETADAMARAISDYTKSNIGIGITGKLNRVDPNNLVGKDNIVFISIYNRDRDESIHSMVSAALSSREENKDIMIEQIIDIMEEKVI